MEASHEEVPVSKLWLMKMRCEFVGYMGTQINATGDLQSLLYLQLYTTARPCATKAQRHSSNRHKPTGSYDPDHGCQVGAHLRESGWPQQL